MKVKDTNFKKKEAQMRAGQTTLFQPLDISQVAKKPRPNPLNEMDGSEWLRFTISWYIFDALASDLDEEKALMGNPEEHPATFSPTMVSDYIRFFTKSGATVLDPFVGIGSTLAACSRTGRRGIGLDINPEYCEMSKKRINGDPNQQVISTNSFKIETLDLPQIDYCITSPPYFTMLNKIDAAQRRKRIEKGLPTDYGVSIEGNLDTYISNLVTLFNKIAELMPDKGYMTVILQNFRDKKRMVPLAWRLAIELDKVGPWVFKGEKIWCQAHKLAHPYGQKFEFVSNVHHHYCLIFRKEA